MRETPSRSIRSPAVAGSFYPQDPRHLADAVDTLLADAQGASRAPARQPYAIVVPHAGYVYSGIVAAAAYRTLAHYRTRFRRVLLIGPAHRVAFEGIAAPSAAFFRTPLGDIPLDTEAISALCSLSGISIRDDAHAQEHSLEVQLPFLQRTLGNFHVIPLIVGSAAPARVEEVISIMTSVPGTLVVISSDLSHYLDYESAEHLDSETVDAILRLDVGGIADRGACGRLPIKGLLGVAHATGLEATLLDRRNSGDTAGPKDRVVGYASMGFYRATGDGLQSTAGEVLLHIADRALRHGLATGKPLPLNPEGYSHELAQPGASFVTLKQGHRLRGCIGSLAAHRPLVADVAENAFAAGFRDPRFSPLDGEDIDRLSTIDVSVLSAPKLLGAGTEGELLGALRPGIDGLILREGNHRATFLPQVWEQAPDRRIFLQHLRRKAGLAPDYWSAHLRFWTYRTQSFERLLPA